MDVVCAAGVVAREDGLDLGHAVLVGHGYGAEECVVDVGVVCEVAVALVDDAAVDACGVGVPEVPPHSRDGLAGFKVDELGLDDDGDAELVFAGVGADDLAGDVVGSVVAVGVEEDVMLPGEGVGWSVGA